MSRSKFIGAALVTVTILLASPAFSHAQAPDRATPLDRRPLQPTPEAPMEVRSDAELDEAVAAWEDTIHYYRIAQHEMAVEAGRDFLALDLNPAEVLRVVRELAMYREYERTLRRATELDGEPGELAEELLEFLRSSRLGVSREGTFIGESIEKLDVGLRHRLSAYDQLRRAGEYAAPQLLEVLLSDSARGRELQPYVIEAMVQVGRPIVSPLSESLAGVPSPTKRQLAEVLGRIGYPLALPYLQAEIEREDVDERTQRVLQRAFDQIVDQAGTPRRGNAADLFLRLAEDYYAARESLILQPNDPHNLMWTYSRDSGLIYHQIPTPIFHDAMAMRTSRRALQLNPNLSGSLSLWVAANFRRENNLPAGEEDPSYGDQMRSPHYYATLAGPRHLHPVLQRALRDRDSALALDAIGALRSTATADSLLNIDGRIQPLITALNFPDRRVRFDAAVAIATAGPSESFEGSQRVVPVLAEAIREAGELYAVVLGPDQEAQNLATQYLSDAGDYRVLRGASVDVVAAQVVEAPGVDLTVVHSPLGETRSAIENVRQNYKLMATPIVVLAHPGDGVTLRRAFEDDGRVFVVEVEEEDTEQVVATIQEATESILGSTLSGDEAESYALHAMDLLKEIKVRGSNPVFDADDARAALLNALDDQREPVALSAADILARFPSGQIQQAIASRAIGSDLAEHMQIAFLRQVATSARRHGNQLSRAQLRDLVTLVNEANSGELADAAAEAHGALNLPTSNVVESITR